MIHIWIAAAATLPADGFQLQFETSGMTRKLGGYRPQRAEMVGASEGIRLPAGLVSPKFGMMEFGTVKVAFVLDEPAGSPSKLIVDSNGNGNLADDQTASWRTEKRGELLFSSGSGTAMVNGKLGTVSMYRFDPKDPQRAALKETLLYYPDFGFSGTASIAGKSYPVAFAGSPGQQTFVWFDRNADGRSQGRSETVGVGQPFNFGQGSFVLTVQAGMLKVEPSSKSVEEMLMPPDLRVGQIIPKFQANDLDGRPITFPDSYKGKIVLLDFWATWCGPCIEELPNVTKAYSEFQSKGFEILGVSLDNKDMADKVRSFTKERSMPWRQIYEGKAWDCTLVKQFGVEGIPFVLLVDGDTGKILADSSRLRGPQISTTIGNALKAKFGTN